MCTYIYIYIYICVHLLHIYILVDVCFIHMHHIYIYLFYAWTFDAWTLSPSDGQLLSQYSASCCSSKKNSSTYPLMYSKLIRMWCAVNFSFWTLWLSAFMIRFFGTFHPSQSNEFPVSLLRCCFLTLSRMNHSCFPNVVYMSDKRLQTWGADEDVGHLQNNMCCVLTPIISIW